MLEGPNLNEKPPKIIAENTPKNGVLIFAYMSDFFGIFTSKKRQKAAKTRHFMAWSNEPRCAIILGVRRKTSRKTKDPKPDAYGGGCSQDPGYRPESGPGKEPVSTLPVHPFCWPEGR